MLMEDFLQRHDTALFREVHGVYWSTEAQLMAVVADALHVGNWQRGGRKTAPKPKPIKRPWEKVKGTVLGSKPIPISKFNDWWDSKKPKRKRRKPVQRRPLRDMEKPPTA